MSASVHVRAASEQCLDDVQRRQRILGLSRRQRGPILVADIDDGVQRRAAVSTDDVHVGSAIDQELREAVLLVHDRHDERAGVVDIAVIDVDAAVEHHAGRLDVALTGGKRQGREPAARDRGDRRRRAQPGHLGFPVERSDLPVGAVIEQELHDGRMAFGRRPHEGGLSLVLLARIHVRAAVEEHPDDIGVACASGRHQDGLAVFSGQRFRVGAGFEQRFDHRRASGRDRLGQRRRAIAVPGLRVRARAEQQVDRVFVVPDDRPMESGGAVGLRGIHIDLALHERAQRADVLLLGGVGRIRAGGITDRRNRRSSEARPATPAGLKKTSNAETAEIAESFFQRILCELGVLCVDRPSSSATC